MFDGLCVLLARRMRSPDPTRLRVVGRHRDHRNNNNTVCVIRVSQYYRDENAPRKPILSDFRKESVSWNENRDETRAHSQYLSIMLEFWMKLIPYLYTHIYLYRTTTIRNYYFRSAVSFVVEFILDDKHIMSGFEYQLCNMRRDFISSLTTINVRLMGRVNRYF